MSELNIEQWKKISDTLPDPMFDHNEPDAKLFLVADIKKPKTPAVAWFVSGVGMFGGNGGIYSHATHWCEIPDLI